MYFVVDDAKYWYEIDGEGIPIVLLHGFTGRTWTWNRVKAALHPDIQVITVDLPGHGNTVTNTPRTMEDCCQDLEALYDYLGLENFHLLGYSMGGRTALSYALDYSNRLASLILESASPGLELEADREERVKKDEMLANEIMQQGLTSFVEKWENIPLFQSQKSLPQELQQEVRKERMSQSAKGLAMSLKSMGTGVQPSHWHQLSTFEKPVLLICGEYDKKFIAINKKMDERFPNSKMSICENAGHAVHVENPENFGKLVSEYVLGMKMH